MIAMRECGPRGVDYLSPLYVLIWIIGSTVVRPADWLRGQPALHWSNNFPSGDMLKG